MPIERTAGGETITCDGCGAPIERVTDEMTHPVPDDVATTTYGQTGLICIVCAPLPDGATPCLDLAMLSDELYERNRCRRPGCDGTNCADFPALPA